MWLFSWAATQPKENPEFNQTYLQHLNEESEAGRRPTEPGERGPLTALALGLFHAPLHSVEGCAHCRIGKLRNERAQRLRNQRTYVHK